MNIVSFQVLNQLLHKCMWIKVEDLFFDQAKKDPIVKKLSMEIARDIEKMKTYEQRIAQIEGQLRWPYCYYT